MTLDEAIKHEEKMAEEQDDLYRICPISDMQFCDGRSDCTSLKNGKDKGCLKCAKEHLQMAEWLKDYKRLSEQQLNEDTVSREAVKSALCELCGDKNNGCCRFANGDCDVLNVINTLSCHSK